MMVRLKAWLTMMFFRFLLKIAAVSEPFFAKYHSAVMSS